MTDVLTAEQMRALEARAMGSGAVSGADLMERAGAGVVAEALARWPELARGPGRALVLAGPGNNGGDGFVVARLLAGRGWEVDLCLFGDAEGMRGDAALNRDRWVAAGGEVGTIPGAAALVGGADLLVDALFGTGLTRGLPEALARLGEAWRGAAGRRVAVDIPSGLSADTGRDLGGAFAAELTVTFHAAKLGHYLAEGPGLCGALAVVPIGLAGGGGVPLVSGEAALLTKRGGHKYDSGHALVLGGGPGRGGAARMAARAALRVGAGLVTLAVPAAALQENAARLDAVMLRALKGEGALAGLLEDARLNALALGPGLGVGAATRQMVAEVLAEDRGTVLDADALSSFAEDPGALFHLLHPHCVLTPHMGEFARLFPDLAERLDQQPAGFSRLGAAREAAARAGAVVLLKGPDTVIAAPDGRARINAAAYGRAVPWLATAGAGDVLTGLVAGLLARGLPAPEAAAQAAWLHVEAARRTGPGLIAEDLPEALPGVLRDLLG